MREVLLLLVGLAAVAALPLQDAANATPKADLLQKILEAKYEENDLVPEHSKESSLAPVATEEQFTHVEGGDTQTQLQPHEQEQLKPQEQEKMQPQEQEQLKPQEQEKMQPQEQEQMQTQEQGQAQSQEQDQLEPEQPAPQEQEQPQPQQVDPDKDPSPHESEPPTPFEPVAEPEPQVEELPSELLPETLEPEISEMEPISFDLSNDYVVFGVNVEPFPPEQEGTFTYDPQVEPLLLEPEGEDFDLEQDEPEMEPLDFEPEPVDFEPEEPEMEPLAFEPEPVDFEPEEPEMEPLSFEPEPVEFEPEEPEMETISFEPEPVEFEPEEPEMEPISFEPEPVEFEPEEPEMKRFLSEEDEEPLEFEPEMKPLSYEPESVVLEPEEPQMEPFPFEEQEETLTYDLEEEPISYEPEMKPFAFHPEESETRPYSFEPEPVEFQPEEPEMDPFPSEPELIQYKSEEPYTEPLPYESEDPYESGDEPPMPETEEAVFAPAAEFGYTFPEEGDQPELEEDDIAAGSEDVFIDESHMFEPQPQPVPFNMDDDVLDWTIPYVPDEELEVHDGSPYSSPYLNYYMMMAEEDFHHTPEIIWDEPLTFMDDAMNSEGPENEGTELGEPILPFEADLDGKFSDEVSLDDFYIPTYDPPRYDTPEEYPQDMTPMGGDIISSMDDEYPPQEPISRLAEEEIHPAEEYLPIILPDQQPVVDNKADMREFQEGGTPIIIWEGQPLPEMESEKPLDKEAQTIEVAEPWDGAKAFIEKLSSTPDFEAHEPLPLAGEDFSNGFRGDDDIIIMNESGDDSEDSPITEGPIIIPERPAPIVGHPWNQHSRPFWVPQNIHQNTPPIFFSITNDLPRREISVFFDDSYKDASYMPSDDSWPYHTQRMPIRKRPVISFMDDMMDDHMHPQPSSFSGMTNKILFTDRNTQKIYQPSNNFKKTFGAPQSFLLKMLLNSGPLRNAYQNTVTPAQPPIFSKSFTTQPHFNGPPRQFSHTSPQMSSYSSFNTLEESDLSHYMPGHDSYLNGSPSFYDSHKPFMSYSPRFHRDNFRPRHFDDFKPDVSFISNDSFDTPPFSSPRPRFPFPLTPRYSGPFTPIFGGRSHPSDDFYSTGPYRTSPYLRYAPDYY